MADSTTAINLTLINEGGFQKDPDDTGNWTGGAKGVGELKGTKYGISAHEFPDLDIENLTQNQADDIYRTGRPPQVPPFWNPLYDQIESQPVANKLFDLGVLFGRGTAVKNIQSLVKMVQDGSFGPHTLVAVNESDPTSLLSAYKTTMVSHAIGIANAQPGKRKDLAGWIKRINA
jgi:lysozyme family protein